MPAILRLQDLITRWLYVLGGVALCGIVISYLIEVVMRYMFNAPTLWSPSAVAYLLCVSSMLAMPELARTRGHIAITMLEERMPAATSARHRRRTAALTAAICLCAAWMIGTEMMRQAQSGTTTAFGVRIPKVWLSGLIFYGFVNTALYYLRATLLPGTLPQPDYAPQEV